MTPLVLVCGAFSVVTSRQRIPGLLLQYGILVSHHRMKTFSRGSFSNS